MKLCLILIYGFLRPYWQKNMLAPELFLVLYTPEWKCEPQYEVAACIFQMRTFVIYTRHCIAFDVHLLVTQYVAGQLTFVFSSYN
jgi:hypothetical protein